MVANLYFLMLLPLWKQYRGMLSIFKLLQLPLLQLLVPNHHSGFSASISRFPLDTPPNFTTLLVSLASFGVFSLSYTCSKQILEIIFIFHVMSKRYCGRALLGASKVLVGNIITSSGIVLRNAPKILVRNFYSNYK